MHLVAHINGARVTVRSATGSHVRAEESSAESGQEPKGPSPIAPEGKELAWGAGAFLVFLILMRLVLVPRVKRGMQERYEGVRGTLESADKATADARADVSAYEGRLAALRDEAAGRVDAARRTVDAERSARLAEVNSRIADMRAEADRRNAALREANRGNIVDAVTQVASRAAELATGRRPADAEVRQIVSTLVQSGGSR
ncbi:MAG: synthase subunit [Actinomycetota bacterium]|jgi:F-type H+-transporting ATPase subunit b